ncbi:MAG: hypothetical protein NDI82_11930 [Anaeromyxobacteraceae bacterium]|nr:hypothetical protein [Anaeromyxobacteraceae bacterium]
MRPATHRLRLALALAAALAGCVVDVEGAACPTPGATTGCPAGQSCGTGGTCSRAAAGCSPCTPGELACRDGDVRRCTAEGDPACGAWAVEAACAAGTTTCDVPAGGAPECRCEAFVADPAGAAASTACRFASAEAAIAEAVRFGVTEVRLGGPAGQDYGGAGPLLVPAGMAVVGDDVPLAPAGRVLTASGPGEAAVRLEAGAALAGLTVRRGLDGPAIGIRVVGASPGAGSSLTAVEVDGLGDGGRFATGVRVEGAGAVALTSVAIRGAASSGLEVERASIDDAVTATDLLVDGEAAAAGPAIGVGLTTGDLTLRRPEVKRCEGAGVVASGSGVTARLTLEGGALHDGFGTGLAAQLLGRLVISGTKVCRNKGGASRNINGTLRLVGGAYLAGAAPAEQSVSGLAVFDNDGDQVVVGLGSGTWNLAGPSASGAACGAGVNAFAGYGAGAYGLVAAANVDASWNAWQGGTPAVGQDVLKIGTPSVILGTEGAASNYCSLPSDLTCPDP